METEKYHAIVLRSIDYKDNDKLVSLYTLERGKLFASLRGVKKAGAKLRYAAEPFCFGEFMAAGRGNGESAGYVITGCAAADLFFDITSDIEKYYAGAAVLECLDAAGLFDEGNKELFFESVNTLKNLAYTSVSHSVILARFLTRVLKICGYKEYPEEMTPAAENTLRLIAEQPEKTLSNLKIPENILCGALSAAGNYFSEQFGRRIKSLDMLKK